MQREKINEKITKYFYYQVVLTNKCPNYTIITLDEQQNDVKISSLQKSFVLSKNSDIWLKKFFSLKFDHRWKNDATTTSI